MEFTKEQIDQYRSICDAGLVRGIGSQADGRMCVLNAMCKVLGRPDGDQPNCVTEAVRKFEYCLNDKGWSSAMARGEGMRDLGIASLGSLGVVNGREFAKRMAIETVRQVVPIALKARGLNAHAARCESATTLEEARAAAADAAYAAASSCAAYDAASYAADAAHAAYAYASYPYASDPSCASYAAAAAAAAYAAASSYAAAASYASYDDAAADDADDAADAADAASSYDDGRDRILRLAASIGVQILRDLGSPGVKWLDMKVAP